MKSLLPIIALGAGFLLLSGKKSGKKSTDGGGTNGGTTNGGSTNGGSTNGGTTNGGTTNGGTADQPAPGAGLIMSFKDIGSEDINKYLNAKTSEKNTLRMFLSKHDLDISNVSGKTIRINDHFKKYQESVKKIVDNFYSSSAQRAKDSDCNKIKDLFKNLNKVEIYFINGNTGKVKHIGDFNHTALDLSRADEEFIKKLISLVGEINYYILASMESILEIYRDKFKIKFIKASSKMDYLNCLT
jgi:hypothetical protein